MKRRYYDSGSLSRALISFEERYGLLSSEFYDAFTTEDEPVSGIPGFEQHLWASFYREVQESDEGDFVASVEHTVQHA